jgi:hypothetical protein
VVRLRRPKPRGSGKRIFGADCEHPSAEWRKADRREDEAKLPALRAARQLSAEAYTGVPLSLIALARTSANRMPSSEILTNRTCSDSSTGASLSKP